MAHHRIVFEKAHVFQNILNHMLIQYIFQPIHGFPKKCFLVNGFPVQDVSKLRLGEDLHQSVYTPLAHSDQDYACYKKHDLLLF